MNSTAKLGLVTGLPILLFLLASHAHAAAPDRATLEKIAKLSVPFVPNSGQWDSRAAFAAQTFAGTLFVTKQGELVYSLPGKPIDVGADSAALGGATVGADLAALPRRQPSHAKSSPTTRTPGWVLSETLVDSKGQPRRMADSTLKAPAGYVPMEGKVSYGIGNDPSKHAENLNTYERVNLGDMYPGVNVQLRATGDNVEKIFTVAPQHDPKQINIKLAGADKLEIGTQGELIAHTGNGPVSFTAPIAFQETVTGARIPVAVAYSLVGADLAALDGRPRSNAKSSPTAATYGFSVGPYDRTRPLVIDPLLQSTYLGGTGSDIANALAIHPVTGDVLIAGYTTSTDLPSVTTASGGVAAGAQSVKSSGDDAFVTRFNAQLTSRLQSTYLGGTSFDIARALAIHPVTGDVLIAGQTDSTDLPSVTVASGGVATGAQSVKSSFDDAFVTRFNAQLTSRLQSTYLGGTGSDLAYALAIHPVTEDVLIAGYTSSTDLPSVTTASGGVATGAQSVRSSGNDAFVTRFNAQLTSRLQSTYLGGTGNDIANALAIHPVTGDVLIAGFTTSTDLPSVTVARGGVATGAQSVKSSGNDAFVTRFNAQLTSRLQSTYLGGTGFDIARALAIHPVTGDVLIAGETDSTDLPSVTVASGGVATGAQSVKSSGTDAFVSKFSFELAAGNLVPNTFAFAPRLNVPISSLQTSDMAQITGVLGNAPISITGGNFAQFCISDSVGCGCDVQPFSNTAATINNNQYVCVRQVAPASSPAQAKATLVVGGGWADFIVSTGTQITSCNFDVDGSGGAPNAASDGLMLVRAMLGFTGTNVTNGAITGSPPRNTWALIRPYLNANCGTSFAE